MGRAHFVVVEAERRGGFISGIAAVEQGGKQR